MSKENTLIYRLKEILPDIAFFKQPDSARKEIIKLENKYRINTSNFLKNPDLISDKKDIEDWFNYLEIFYDFVGDEQMINHLKD